MSMYLLWLLPIYCDCLECNPPGSCFLASSRNRCAMRNRPHSTYRQLGGLFVRDATSFFSPYGHWCLVCSLYRSDLNRAGRPAGYEERCFYHLGNWRRRLYCVCVCVCNIYPLHQRNVQCLSMCLCSQAFRARDKHHCSLMLPIFAVTCGISSLLLCSGNNPMLFSVNE